MFKAKQFSDVENSLTQHHRKLEHKKTNYLQKMAQGKLQIGDPVDELFQSTPIICLGMVKGIQVCKIFFSFA